MYALIIDSGCNKLTPVVFDVAPTIQQIVDKIEKRVPWKLVDYNPVSIDLKEDHEEVNIPTYLELTKDGKWSQETGCVCDDDDQCVCADAGYCCSRIVSRIPYKAVKELFGGVPISWVGKTQKVALTIMAMNDVLTVFDIMNEYLDKYC